MSNSIIYIGIKNQSIVEALGSLDDDTDSNNCDIGFINFLLRQLIFRTICTLRLNLDFKAATLALLFKSLLGHIGMCDSRRTCGNTDNFHSVSPLLLVVAIYTVFKSVKIGRKRFGVHLKDVLLFKNPTC